MLGRLIDFMEGTNMSHIRMWGLITIAFGLLIVAGVAFPRQTVNPIEVEHRFTTLEEKVDDIVRELQELKWARWVELLGLSGLVGEAGLRISRRPK